jgi:hypothetical protein
MKYGKETKRKEDKKLFLYTSGGKAVRYHHLEKSVEYKVKAF